MPLTAEAEQLEIPEMPERSPLGKACKKYLDIKEKIKDLQEDASEAARDVMQKLRDEGSPGVRFSGWEFELDTPDMKLLCHPVKGKSENQKKVA